MSLCINCKKEISAIEDNIYSGYCENCYEEIKGKETKSNTYNSQSNSVATILKVISTITFIIGIIIFGIIKIVPNINNSVSVSDDMIKISSAKKVENLENIEITNLTIEKKESAYSIKLNFKN